MTAKAKAAAPTLIELLGPREVVHRGRLIEVCEQPVRLPNGRKARFEIARRPPGVRVILTTANNVLLSKEWRHEHNNWDYRLPGGKVVDDFASLQGRVFEKEELVTLAMAAAARELEEETGVVDFRDLNLVHVSTCGATVEWDLYFFAARTDSKYIPDRPTVTKEGECVVPGFYSFDEAIQLFLDGHILEDRAASVLMRFLMARQAMKQPSRTAGCELAEV